MKRTALWLLLSIALFGCTFTPIDQYTGTWTIMVYLDGDNNLEPEALQDFNEMENINLTGSGVQIVVLVDRSAGYTAIDGDWKGTRLYKVGYDTDVQHIGSTRLSSSYLGLSDTGDSEELNMGEKKTLEMFVNYCKSTYQSQYYALIFWNHGDGWRGTKGSTKTKGIAYDSTSGNDYLSNPEVREALDGKGISVIGYDACDMGMLEMLYELQDCADYIIASQDAEPGSGWQYNEWLSNFISGEKTPKRFYQSVIDSFAHQYRYYMTCTLAAYDTSKVEAVASAFEEYVADIYALTNTWWNSGKTNYCKALFDQIDNNVEQFIEEDPYKFHLDIADLADQIPMASSEALKAAIADCVVYEWHQSQGDIFSGNPRATGIAIYFGTYFPWDERYTPGYTSAYEVYAVASYTNGTNYRFHQQSKWDNFLKDFYDFPHFTWIGAGSFTNSITIYEDAFYQFYVATPGTISLSLFPPSDSDDELYIYSGNLRTPVDYSADGGIGVAEYIDRNFDTPGWYIARIYRKNSDASPGSFVFKMSNISAVLR